jgi:hypothetical protein
MKIEQVVTNDKNHRDSCCTFASSSRSGSNFLHIYQKTDCCGSCLIANVSESHKCLGNGCICFTDGCCKFCSATPNIDSFLASERNRDIPVCPGYHMLRKYESKCQTDRHLYTVPRSFVFAFLLHDWFPQDQFAFQG